MSEVDSKASTAGGVEAPSPPAPGSVDPERLSLALIVASVAAMVALSYQRWADPVIDFGRELYVAWRMSEGDQLYRDVFYPYSPLSPLINLGWFKLFGVAYRSIVIGNAILLAAILLTLYSLLRRISSLFTATAGLLVVVLVFAFGQYVGVGNYNYLSPYSHEVTHGLLLSLLVLMLLARYFETGARGTLAAAGFVLGLAFLTKYEIFLAISVAAAAGLGWFWFANRPLPWTSHLALFLLPLPLPFVACWGFLAGDLGAGPALASALGAYPLLLNAEHSSNPFFWRSAGLSSSGWALTGLLGWTGLAAVSVLPAAFLGRGGMRLDDRVYTTASFLLPLAATTVLTALFPWNQALLPLPLALAVRAIWLLRGRDPAGRPSTTRVLEFAMVVFALLLLLRILFFARVSHYGFALAMPGTVLLLVAGLEAVPAWLSSRRLDGRLFRVSVCGLLVAFVWNHVDLASQRYRTRTFSVGDGGDTLRVDALGSIVGSAVSIVHDRVKPNETLVVLPEGAFVNFVTRRRSSVPLVVFHPTAVAMYGERAIVSMLTSAPPDHVLALSRHVRSLQEMGCQAFGEDCGQEIAAWLRRGYAPRVIATHKGRRYYTLFARHTDGAASTLAPEVVELPSLR